MTVGIYCLRFIGTNKVYIGQSINIERRFTDHIRLLTNTSASNKLQEAYNLYGKPTYNIIVECKIIELDKLEQEAIEIYNSVEEGYNTLIDAGAYGTLSGPDHYNAKYSREQILESFLLLYNSDLSIQQISNKFGVPRTILSGIKSEYRYVWISEVYPKEYKEYLSRETDLSRSHSAKSLGISYPPIKSPEGEVFSISNIKKFALEHKIDPSSLGKVLRGYRSTHRGWKVCPHEQVL